MSHAFSYRIHSYDDNVRLKSLEGLSDTACRIDKWDQRTVWVQAARPVSRGDSHPQRADVNIKLIFL